MAFDKRSDISTAPVLPIAVQPLIYGPDVFRPATYRVSFDSGLAPPLDPGRNITVLRL
jgi:hypothetical protein